MGKDSSSTTHQLTVTLPPEPVFLEADAARLTQVFQNLLNNAAKYTPQTGHIWLTAEMSRQQERPEVMIQVRDTGIGIPQEMLARIFKMSTQVDRSLERSTGGLGIGLTLVKRLVEMHGGAVEARSAGPNQGSEFIVHLPVAAPHEQAPEPERDGAIQGRATAHRILVVDDNRDAADSLAMLLRMQGGEVRTAHDGAEALDVTAGFQPEPALIDLGMPRLNGYELARKIRQEPWGRHTVLVALTGWGQEEARRHSKEAGFDYHLTKPVDLPELQSLLFSLQGITGQAADANPTYCVGTTAGPKPGL